MKKSWLRRSLFGVAVLLLQLSASAAEPFEWGCAADGGRIDLSLRVAPGFYLSAETLQIIATGGSGEFLDITKSPVPVEYDGGDGIRSKIFPAGEWRWVLRGEPPFALTVEFNGCQLAAGGEPPVCLPPATLQLLPVRRTEAALLSEQAEAEVLDIGVLTSGFQPVKTLLGAVPKEEFLRWLDAGEAGASEVRKAAEAAAPGFFGILLAALVGGLALNLTPCVLPLIPVNLIIIGASGGGRRRGFLRGLAYGAGMALTYGAVGAAVVFAGARFGELNTSPVFNFAVAGVFLILGAAMAGLFHIDIGSFFSRRRRGQNGNQGGTFFTALVMGGFSALLAGACVAPAVIAVLVLAAARFAAGEIWAVILPFCLGIGMALPWPLAGMGLAVLPKPGKFMVRIKYLFAAVIVGIGMWYLHTGITLLPDSGYSAEAETAKLQSVLAEGRREGKTVVVDFWAPWCKNCKDFEKRVLDDPEVKKKLSGMKFLRFRADRLNDPAIKKLFDAWGIHGLPAIVLLAPAGTI